LVLLVFEPRNFLSLPTAKEKAMDCPIDIEEAVAKIEATKNYRVLRRVDHRDLEGRETCDVGFRIGLVVDVETTGIDRSRSKIIEFAARMFWATYDGEIVAVGPSHSWLEDPGESLSPEIVRLTGLTDADLAFCSINDVEVAEMLVRADFVVAHNAHFDRPFLERRFPKHVGLAWCCSCHDIDWTAHGFEGRGLGWLLSQCGKFHKGHRATADVDATIALLRNVLPNGRTALAEMLDAAERPAWIVSAVGAHFDVKEGLKARGYRWEADASVWCREVADTVLADERVWLAENVYQPEFRPRATEPSIAQVTWLSRYSS
jgi:DNA polymerase-3 subunit epsilon